VAAGLTVLFGPERVVPGANPVGEAARVLVTSGVLFGGYVAVLAALGSPELRDLWAVVRDRFLRPRRS
jgi:hypothetical protein